MQDELPPFEPLDAAPGPALPLSPAQALARADALVERRLRKRRVARFGLLLAAALSVTTGALGAVLWETRAARHATPAAPVGAGARRPAAERVSSSAPAPVEEKSPNARQATASQQPAQRSPRDWLELANAARARREFAAAERLYLRVVSTYPGTDDAAAAQLAAADLRSQHLGRAKDALPLYRELLAARPRGALAEHARVGLARAHGSLGERDAERTVWRELLRYHPDSWFAQEAKMRLHASEQK